MSAFSRSLVLGIMAYLYDERLHPMDEGAQDFQNLINDTQQRHTITNFWQKFL
ncbi:MAG: hypothetical protein VKK59_05795 [Vampirovibrionales bacterium]|nr:hypothetical protein [Vampirovibrionales bacterium]